MKLTLGFPSKFRFSARIGFALGGLVVALLGAAICRTATEARWRAGVVERSTARFSTDDGERVETSKIAENLAFRDEFDERLLDGAARYLTANGDALRTVVVGLARWGVDERTSARFLETLTLDERAFASEIWANSESFQFEAERAAVVASSRNAGDALAELKNGAESAPGVDAALEFLRELDGSDVSSAENVENFEKKTVASFLWAFDFVENPLDSVGVLAASDVVLAARPAASATRRAFESTGAFFCLLAFVPFGGGAAPESILETLGGAAIRATRNFFERLRRRARLFVAALKAFVSISALALLAQLPKFRRFGVDSPRILSPFDAALTTVRLLN